MRSLLRILVLSLVLSLSAAGGVAAAEGTGQAAASADQSGPAEVPADRGGEEQAGEESSLFFAEDGEFDISGWLASRHGFLPTPIIITGPTLGAGGGLNLAFMHGNMTGTKASNGRIVPPTITGVAAAATENGSMGAGVYNQGFWFEDRLRTTFLAGRPDLNVDFYPDVLGRETSMTVNLKGWAFYQEAKLRLGDSDFLMGGNYVYSHIEASAGDTMPPALAGLLDRSYSVAGLAAVLEYDSRDTIFTPTRGLYGKLVARTYADWLGGDSDFMAYSGKIFQYLPLVKDRLDLALRLQGDTVGDNAPFFLYPSVQMRGIPGKRYQGRHAVVGEAELNWRVYKRWHLIGFFGGGKAFGGNKLASEESFADADWHLSKGLGFRYDIADKFGLQVGGDVAWGPEDTAFYITMGSAWNSFF